LDDKIKDAEENYGDIEIRDAILEKADFYAKIKDKVNAIKTYEVALSKTLGVAKKMEIEFSILLIYMEDKNLEKIKEIIEK